jgi:hypothetical protein
VFGQQRPQPALGATATRGLHRPQLARRFHHGETDAERREERRLAHRCTRTGRIEDHPGTVGAGGEVVGLAQRVAPLAQLQLYGRDVPREGPPGAGGPDHVPIERDKSLLRQRVQGRARQRAGVRREPCGERRGAHPAVLTEHVEGADAKGRGQRPRTNIEAASDGVGVEAHGDDVGDALRSGDLAHHEVRAAAGHEAAHLAGDELGHVRFPAEPVAFTFVSGVPRRLRRGREQHPRGVGRDREQHQVCIFRRPRRRSWGGGVLSSCLMPGRKTTRAS